MTLTAAIVAFVNAVLACIIQFGVTLTVTQTGSITLAVNAACVLGALLFDKLTNRTLKPPPAGSASWTP